jgi:hypothetical protein
MSEDLKGSIQNGAHALLRQCVGSYTGTARTWFEPGEPIDIARVKGRLKMVLGGRFLLHEYEGSFQGKPLEGIALTGFSLGEGRWQTAWIDSFHNGTRIMFSQGGPGGDPQSPDVTGSYPAAPDPDWGWRTTIEVPSADRLLITHYNITPQGQEVKAVEFDYERVADAGTPDPV